MRFMSAYQVFVATTMMFMFHGCNDTGNAPVVPTVASALTVQSMSPMLSPTRGGVLVDIKGTGFLPGMTVTFDHESVVATWISESEVKVVTPALEIQGPISVRVANPASTETKVENLFTYYSTTVSLNPNSFVPEIDPSMAMVSIDLLGDGNMTLVAGEWNEEGKNTVLDQFIFDPQTEHFQKTPLASLKAYLAVLITADLNRDGKSDLIAGSETGTVFVLLNDGHGNFLAPLPISLGKSEIGSLAIGDFNQDERMDISAVTDSSVFTLLNDGKNGFQISQTSETGANSWALAPIDYDHDGAIDLVLIDNETVLFLKSNQNGTFQPPIPLKQIPKVADMKTADIDGDQRQDLILLTSEDDPKMLVLLNQAHSFKALDSLSVPHGANELLLADMDGDHLLDVVVDSWDGTMAIFLGKGHGWLGAPIYFNGPVSNFVIAILDINGDHKPDLITEYPGISYDDFKVGLILNNSQ